MTHLFSEQKIDCHAHIFDPARFPYGENNRFHPAGGELGSVEQLGHVMQAYGVHHVLLVQPNSGYGGDNRYLLDAIEHGAGRYKGIAIVPHNIGLAELQSLRAQGIVGAALNTTFDGVAYYRNARGLLEKLAELEMFANIQVQDDELLSFMPWLENIPVRILLDHCGRPRARDGMGSATGQALAKLAASGRAYIKISGFSKFSHRPYPFTDIHRQVLALIDAFGWERCLWASDWPFLRAPARQDYGPLLQLAATTFFPDARQRRAVFWDNPRKLFGFDTAH